MNNKTIFRIAAAVLFLFFFTGINITHSNIIEKRDEQIIRMAYMNGSVDALKLDIKQIKKMKSDDEYRKSVVVAAADNYIKIVESLTEKTYNMVNNQRSTFNKETGRKRINTNDRLW